MEKSLKILLADESSEQRRYLREALLSFGYRNIDEAANGEEAVKLLQENTYDAVVLDVIMPKIDGIGVLEKILNKNGCSPLLPSLSRR